MSEPIKTIYYIPDEVAEGAEQTFSPVYFENVADNVLLSDTLSESLKASTVEEALLKMPEKAEKPAQYSLTILSTDWSTIDGEEAYIASIKLDEIKTTSLFIVSAPNQLSKEKYEEFGKCGVVFNTIYSQGGAFSLKALIEKPSIDLPIIITIIEQSSLTPNCIISLPGGTAGLKVQKTSVDGEFDRLESDTLFGTTRINYNGYFYATRTYGAVFNDYAEFRPSVEEYLPGTIVTMNEDGLFEKSQNRLGSVGKVVTDTYGMCIGENQKIKYQVPIAVSGRALVYMDQEILPCHIGEPVCVGENGKASLMTKEEIMLYPHKIIGIISSIPKEKIWGTNSVLIDGRIWIEVR